jgi:hypothetical protein
MRACPECCGVVADNHRFCPWCAASLRLKIVEWFAPPSWLASDDGKRLRVTRYLPSHDTESHIRFSV